MRSMQASRRDSSLKSVVGRMDVLVPAPKSFAFVLENDASHRWLMLDRVHIDGIVREVIGT